MYLPLHICLNYAFMITRLRFHIVLVRILFLFHAKKNRNKKRCSTPQRQEPLELAMSMKDARVNQQELYDYACHPCM